MQQAFLKDMQRRFSRTAACLTPQLGRTSGPGEDVLLPLAPQPGRTSGPGEEALPVPVPQADCTSDSGGETRFFSESRRQIIQKAVCYNIPPPNEKSTRMSAKILKQTADRVQCHLKNDEIEVGRKMISFNCYPPDPSPEALFWGNSLFFPAVSWKRPLDFSVLVQ